MFELFWVAWEWVRNHERGLLILLPILVFLWTCVKDISGWWRNKEKITVTLTPNFFRTFPERSNGSYSEPAKTEIGIKVDLKNERKLRSDLVRIQFESDSKLLSPCDAEILKTDGRPAIRVANLEIKENSRQLFDIFISQFVYLPPGVDRIKIYLTFHFAKSELKKEVIVDRSSVEE